MQTCMCGAACLSHLSVAAMCACGLLTNDKFFSHAQAVSRDIAITDIRLEQKSGGRSGHYQRGMNRA